MGHKGKIVTLIAAVARNGIIGGDNRLLWRLSSDLKRFKALTMGKVLLMGRKTFESIGRPLPGRETIVVTRDRSFAVDGVHVSHSLDDAFEMAASLSAGLGADEIMVAGGGDIYAQCMDRADRLALTEVDMAPEGDARFPQINPAEWQEISRENHPAGPKDETAHAFVIYHRR